MKTKLLIAAAIIAGLIFGVVVAKSQTQHKVTLTWSYTQGSDAATGFTIYREAAGGSYAALNTTLVPVGTPTYADTTVVSGTIYNYYVVAVDAEGNQSAPSNIYTTTAIPGNPNSPTNLTGSVQ
jgi:endoglucanase